MLKENKWKIFLTSFITLLPILVGLALWDYLPERIPIHFDFNGTPDNWAGKAFAVFGMPLIMLGCHLICILATSTDPKKNNIGKKTLSLLFWIVPMISVGLNAGLYAYAMDIKLGVSTLCLMIVGVMSLIMGNIIPKVKQNYSFGIKTSWALEDPDNWYHTHRVAGWCMVTSGLILIATSFAANLWIVLASVTLSGIIPCVYSYIYYIRHGGGK